MACGNTIRVAIVLRPKPSDLAASVCPLSTERIPVRNTSARYAPSCSPRPMVAATHGVITLFIEVENSAGPPKGTPRLSLGNSSDRLNQNSSCASSGTLRNPHW